MEAMRYLGAGEGDDALRRQLAAVASELTAALEPRYVYRVFDLARENGDILLAGTGVRLTGATASTMLAQCRTYRRSGGCLACRNLKLDKSYYFLCHLYSTSLKNVVMARRLSSFDGRALPPAQNEELSPQRLRPD